MYRLCTPTYLPTANVPETQTPPSCSESLPSQQRPPTDGKSILSTIEPSRHDKARKKGSEIRAKRSKEIEAFLETPYHTT